MEIHVGQIWSNSGSMYNAQHIIKYQCIDDRDEFEPIFMDSL